MQIDQSQLKLATQRAKLCTKIVKFLLTKENSQWKREPKAILTIEEKGGKNKGEEGREGKNDVKGINNTFYLFLDNLIIGGRIFKCLH